MLIRPATISRLRAASWLPAAAARFEQRGHRVLADDVAVIEIEDEPRVRTVTASLKLWRDTFDVLGLALPASAPVRRSQERYWRAPQPEQTHGGHSSVSLRAIFLLSNEAEQTRALPPGKAAMALSDRVTAGPFAAIGDTRALTRTAHQLAQHVPVVPVRRPSSFAELDAWLDTLEERSR